MDSAILRGMVFGIERRRARVLSALVWLTLQAGAGGIEEQFSQPPANATRPCVALKIARDRLDSEWIDRQLERVRDLGAGGVLLDVPTADEAVWTALDGMLGCAQRLGLDAGLRDFPLSPDESAALPRARRLVWSCGTVPAAGEAVTNAAPQIFRPAASYREIARLAVPDDKPDLQPYHLRDLTAEPVPTGGVWRVCRFGVEDVVPQMIDPFDKTALFRHVNQWLFASQGRLNRAYGSTLLWYQLSGPQNLEMAWPGDLPETFQRRSGIGLMRHLPALAGVAVGGAATAASVRQHVARTVRAAWRERFGRTVDDLVHEAGLEAGIRIDQVSVDPVEVALYFRRPTLVPAQDAARREANILAAGGARTMGRRYVTGLLSPVAAAPTQAAVLLPFPWKHEADRLLADGATRLLLDVGDSGLPSQDADFRQLQEGCRYIHRCQVMLQQGQAVADVLVWAPRPPAALAAYSCDYANDAMLETATVRNGTIRFDSGRAYSDLAVTAEALNDPAAERMARQMAARGVALWLVQQGQPEEAALFARLREAGGKVAVVDGAAAGGAGGMRPDFQWQPGTEGEGVRLRFLHRRTDAHEVYFVVNDSAETGTAACAFRDAGKGVPSRWEPGDGEIGVVEGDVRRGEDGRVAATLFFAPHDACFIVFER